MASEAKEEEEEEEEDGMDSLFEGMVLFNPSSQFTPPPQPADDNQPDHQDPTNDASASLVDKPVPNSLPLDENLFSDLTLVTPPAQTLSDTSSLSPSPITPSTDVDSSNSRPTTSNSNAASREVRLNRKKKRAAGLRVGYGRDSALTHSLYSEPQLPPPSSPLPSPCNEITVIHEEKLEEEEEEEEQVENGHELMEDENDRISECLDSSRTSTDEGSTARIADSVPDAEPVTDSSRDLPEEEDDKQLNTSTSIINSNAIELRFEEIRAKISDKLKHAGEVVASVSAARKESIRRRRKAAENLNVATAKYEELETQLEESCEAEDFEAAERVSESLASAEKEKELSLLALKDAEADCDAVELEMLKVLESQIAAEEECASLLERFAADAANDADLVLKNAEVLSSKEMNEWDSSTEALEVKKMELEIESHVINDARFVLNESIDHIVHDDRRERELLCKRKEKLTEELEKLVALVKAKEAEIVENNSNIEKVDKRIDDVVSSYQEMQSSIDAKFCNLQSGLARMELENEALAIKKKEIHNFLSQEEARGEKIRELAKTSGDEANSYKELVALRKSLEQFILNSNEHKVRLAKTEEKLSEDLKMLRQEVSAARASLQDLSSTKSSIQQEIESFKQRLLFIDKRVPELEAEKKVAATARNFKEAARIATEAKTLSVEKEGVHNNMERAMLDLAKLEEEIGNTINRLDETETQISSKEMELATARFQKLHLISGLATAERSAALELGDLEEADILLAEAKAADFEASKLQSGSNVKEGSPNLPKHFISVELVSHLDWKQLTELTASVQVNPL